VGSPRPGPPPPPRVPAVDPSRAGRRAAAADGTWISPVPVRPPSAVVRAVRRAPPETAAPPPRVRPPQRTRSTPSVSVGVYPPSPV
jgi:hypothetical protein